MIGNIPDIKCVFMQYVSNILTLQIHIYTYLSFSFHTSTQKDPDSQVEDSDDAVNEDLLDMSTNLEIHGIITGT